ncbi:putative ATP-dependent RNA helicase ddx18 [Astathelohania contejeani]|uniref:ATP-dependent RNA helicase n=1 Tax=Astathelohania contejeani TaxID=164912 RepID=A0ABQ7I107_9MICR|nr:putative ATP-dependent RNA helicase ddx18 [Thelohania contejeani]
MGDLKFTDLKLTPELQKVLKSNNFEVLTPIQASTITPIMEGRNIIARAQTGSGKTLAFAVPTIEIISKIDEKTGIMALIIAPTRELAMQTYDLIQKLVKSVNLTVGLCIGGVSRRKEEKMFQNDPSIIVSTPGRLLDHIKSTGIRLSNVKILIIDEFDKMLEIGFEETIIKILKRLPSKRQNLLFSATMDDKMKYMVTMEDPLFINIENNENIKNNLKEYFIKCTESERISILNSLLKKNIKTIVFFNSCNSVIFHYNLFQYWRFKCWGLHGNMKQNKRNQAFKEFGKADDGILFCTDVCARGIDFSDIERIVQYDPPLSEREYVHRIGRTARAGKKGIAILFLHSFEISFIDKLNEIKEKKFESKDITKKLFKLIEQNYYLRGLAINALKSYIHAYKGHPLKENFDISNLNIENVAKSFGFQRLPKIDFLDQ